MRQVAHLNALHERFEEAGLAVVGVTNEDEDLVRATAARARVAYPIALTPGDDADAAYGVRAVPKVFLVDRAGTIAWNGHPAELDEALLQRLLDD